VQFSNAFDEKNKSLFDVAPGVPAGIEEDASCMMVYIRATDAMLVSSNSRRVAYRVGIRISNALEILGGWQARDYAGAARKVRERSVHFEKGIHVFSRAPSPCSPALGKAPMPSSIVRSLAVPAWIRSSVGRRRLPRDGTLDSIHPIFPFRRRNSHVCGGWERSRDQVVLSFPSFLSNPASFPFRTRPDPLVQGNLVGDAPRTAGEGSFFRLNLPRSIGDPSLPWRGTETPASRAGGGALLPQAAPSVGPFGRGGNGWVRVGL